MAPRSSAPDALDFHSGGRRALADCTRGVMQPADDDCRSESQPGRCFVALALVTRGRGVLASCADASSAPSSSCSFCHPRGVRFGGWLRSDLRALCDLPPVLPAVCGRARGVRDAGLGGVAVVDLGHTSLNSLVGSGSAAGRPGGEEGGPGRCMCCGGSGVAVVGVSEMGGGLVAGNRLGVIHPARCGAVETTVGEWIGSNLSTSGSTSGGKALYCSRNS